MNQSLFSETEAGTGISNDTHQHLSNNPGVSESCSDSPLKWFEENEKGYMLSTLVK